MYQFLWDFRPGGNVEHIENHGVTPEECEEVFDDPGSLIASARGGAKQIIGQTGSGRYLRIIFRLMGTRLIKVITAYELPPKAKKAFRRRQKR